MKNMRYVRTFGMTLVTGLAVVVIGVLAAHGLAAAKDATRAAAAPAQVGPAQVGAALINGAYSGAVDLRGVVAGVFSDNLVVPDVSTQPDLGSIDLSLQLTQTGNTLGGYVSLDKTLVFSIEHTLGTGPAAVKTGPFVNGVFDGANLVIESEKITQVVSGRTVQRQFRLAGVSMAADGSQVSGEYRETLWGYASRPVTVIGTFTLQRPGFGAIVPTTGAKAPEPVADAVSTAPGAAVTLNVLANDADPGGSGLTVVSVSKPQFGTATTNGQAVTYTPNAGFVGTDSFSYFVRNGQGGTATGSVSITVAPGGQNQAPTAANDTAATTQGSTVLIDVLANDADANSDALTITISAPPAHGTAVVENGKIRYTPGAGFTGVDSLTYTVSDGKGGTASATVSITVDAPGGQNQAPAAANDTATTTQGSAVIIDVLANDVDGNGDPLTVTITVQPANGTAVVENGKIRYTPAAGFTGADSLTYTVSDGRGGTAGATVSITVTPAGQASGSSVYLPTVRR